MTFSTIAATLLATVDGFMLLGSASFAWRMFAIRIVIIITVSGALFLSMTGTCAAVYAVAYDRGLDHY